MTIDLGFLSNEVYCELILFQKSKKKKAIAIDSRLSIAKVRYLQPVVNSELSLLTASYIFIYITAFLCIIKKKKLFPYIYYCFHTF